jgi:glycosyltransferase involved in cell wall biosynthesis
MTLETNRQDADSQWVSIVIACYNYERYVRLAIDSALAQTWPYVQIVVVDDGSTDGSANVIASYGNRIHSVHQPNAGHVAAFNRGFAECSGSWVVFLDADDLLYPECVSAAMSAVRAGSVKVQYNLDVIGSNGENYNRCVCHFPIGYNSDAIRAEFLTSNTYMWPVSSGNAYARSFLEQMLPLTVRIAPDGILNTVAPLFGDVVTLDRAHGCYRIHQSNKSYHGVGTKRVEERFSKRIALRRSEERGLQALAAERGITLAKADLLDHELVFINYRLMVKKLGEPYDGSADDTLYGLWRHGIRFLLRRPLTLRFRIQNSVWLTVLAVAPKALARHLVLLRFNRDAALQPLRQAGATLRGFFHRTP